MKQDKIVMHERAINLARRFSEQNENDLVMEDYMEKKKTMSHDQCAELSRHLLHETALPAECKRFQDVVTSVKRRDSDTTHPTQYLS
ncbi:MAG: hypothetical protein SGILL_001081 [Bacillariaceae sp.]